VLHLAAALLGLFLFGVIDGLLELGVGHLLARFLQQVCLRGTAFLRGLQAIDLALLEIEDVLREEHLIVDGDLEALLVAHGELGGTLDDLLCHGGGHLGFDALAVVGVEDVLDHVARVVVFVFQLH